MLIRNYGLFWLRSKVVWGTGAKGGHIRGMHKNGKTKPMSFDRERGVYVLYDEGYQLVYVGQTGSGEKQRLFDRLRNHTRDQLMDRWVRFSWFGIEGADNHDKVQAEVSTKQQETKEVLNHIEAILIAVTEPRLNRAGGRFGDSVTQWLQYSDKTVRGGASPA